MTRLAWITTVAASLAISGCQKDQTSIEKKLDGIDQRLAGIEKSLATGGGPRAGAARPAPRARPPGPNPNVVYSVPIEGAPFKGNEDAKVTVVKAFEFACPYCKKVRPTMDQLLEDYGDDVKVVYKHYVVHPQSATIPARAACAAGRQGKFAQMEELIWSKGFDAGRNLSQENMEKLAAEAQLDIARFKADMEGACVQVVQSDQAQLAAVGARGTPAFFINGRFLSGARPVDQFKALVDEELAKANKRLEGKSAAGYYQEWVLSKGEKRLKPQG